MTEATDDQPVEGDELSPDTGVDLAADTDAQDDADGNPEGEEEELEDYEVNGKTVQLPKSVKEELVKSTMLQSDYTRKTQDLAEARRAFDQEKQAQAEHSRAFQEESAKLYTVRQQLKAYEEFTPENWHALAQEDAVNDTQNVSLHRIQWDRLKAEADKLETGIKTKTDERLQSQQREAAKLIEQRDSVLTSRFPKWADEFPKVQAFAVQHLGVPAKDVAATTDPRLLTGLYYAKLGFEAEQRSKTAAQRQAEQQVRPATTVAASSPRQAPTTSPAWRGSNEAWAEQRNREIAEKARKGQR